MLHNNGNDLLAAHEADNSRKCAIVVQGGAMRGIYSMAVLYALQDMGLHHSFQDAYASSAGALNLAYMLADQTKDGVEVYLNHISNRKFIDFFRFWKIADIDFMIDQVVAKSKKLNLDSVMKSATNLHVYCTDVMTSKSTEFSNRDETISMLDLFRASAGMPILYNKWTMIKDRAYVDGGVANNIPLLNAIENGCQDILVVLTKPLGDRKREVTGISRVLYKILMGKYPLEFKLSFLKEDSNYNKVCSMLDGSSPSAVNIYVIHPSDQAMLVNRTTTSRNDLIRCAMMAVNDCRRFFGYEETDKNPFGFA